MIEAAVRELVRLFRTIEPNTKLSEGGITELAIMPALVLSQPTITEVKRMRHDFLKLYGEPNLESHSVETEVCPRWYDIRFTVVFACKSNVELLRMFETFSQLPQRAPLLHATDEKRTRAYSWEWVKFPSQVFSGSISSVHEGRGELSIRDVEVYSGISDVVPLIKNINIGIESGEGNDFIRIAHEEV